MKKPVARWGSIGRRLSMDHGDYDKIGSHDFNNGYVKGRLAIKWPDGFEQEVVYRTNAYEPIGSNGPHCHDTSIYIEIHGVEVEVTLRSLIGKALGRVLSIEEDDL